MAIALSAKDIERFRQRLVRLERDLVSRLGSEMEIGREFAPDQAEVGDIAQVEQLKDEYFQLANVNATTLADVRAALDRIKEGRYGECVVDGGPIGRARLDVQPWTPYCLEHQEQFEQAQRAATPPSL